MKIKILLLLLFFTQMNFACDCLDFKKAQIKAQLENKFILVHFSTSFAAYDNGEGYLEIEGLSEEEQKLFDKQFVYVCIVNYFNNKSKQKYNVGDSTELLILDANGTEIYRFTSKDNEKEIYKVLINFIEPISNLSNDLQQFKKSKNYYSGIKIAQKYFDFATNKNDTIKEKILKVAEIYLNESKNSIKKSDKSKDIKLQNFELLNLYHWMFINRFDIINEKISMLNENEIKEENKSLYYFLKYLCSKKLTKSDIVSVEEKFKTTENYDYYSKKASLF